MSSGPKKIPNIPDSATGSFSLLDYLIVANGASGIGRGELGQTILNEFKANLPSGSTVSNKTDIGDMLAGTYTAGDLIKVNDASAHSTLSDSTYAIFQYLGGGTTTIGNYFLWFAREWFKGSFISIDAISGLSGTNSQDLFEEINSKVNNLAGETKWKSPDADLATTGNITLSGEQTIDGTLTSASRVLVKDQTAPEENGVYDTAAGAWTRTDDCDSAAELVQAVIQVAGGTVNGNTTWRQINNSLATLETDPVTWLDITGAQVPDWSTTTKGKVERATQGEAEANASDTLGLSVLQGFNQWLSNATNYVHAGLTTTVKTILGAINELKSALDTNTADIAQNTSDISDAETDIAQNISDIGDLETGKADVVPGTANNYSTLTGTGQLQDSGDSKASLADLSASDNNKMLSVLRGKQLIEQYSIQDVIDAGNATASSGNGSTTGLSPSQTPAGRVRLVLDGYRDPVVGDGNKLWDAYYSADVGATALSFGNITTSSVLYWNDTGTNPDGTERIALASGVALRQEYFYALGTSIDLTGADIESILDAYFGNTDWRTGGGTGATLGFGNRTMEASGTAPPSDQSIKHNAGDTITYVDDQDLDSEDRSTEWLEVTVGSILTISVVSDPENNYERFKITAIEDSDGYFTITRTLLKRVGTITGEVSVDVDMAAKDTSPINEPWTETLLFDRLNRASTFGDTNDYSETLTENKVFAYNTTGAIQDGGNVKEVVGNGTYTLTFPANAGGTRYIRVDTLATGSLVGNVYTPANGERVKVRFNYDNGEVEVLIQFITVLEDDTPPSATSVAFTGTEEVGEELSGSYTYNANDGGSESGTTFQWYRADDGTGTNEAAIGGATSIDYTLVSADEGKFLRFGVTPSDGTLTGSEAFSSYSGAIDLPTLDTPTITLTAEDGQVRLQIDTEDAAATGRVWLRSTTNDIGTASAVAGYDNTDDYDDDDDGGGLSNGTEYFYWFYNTASGYNNSAEATDSATPSLGLTPLNSPTLSSVTVNGMDSVALVFTDPNSSPAEVGIRVRYSTDSGMASPTTGVTFAANATSGSQPGIPSDTLLYFQVQAIGNGTTESDSAWSNIVAANTNTWIFNDDFNDNSLDSGKWSLQNGSDASVIVTEQNQRLELSHTGGVGGAPSTTHGVVTPPQSSKTDLFVIKHTIRIPGSNSANGFAAISLGSGYTGVDRVGWARSTSVSYARPQFQVRDSDDGGAEVSVNSSYVSPVDCKTIYNKSTGDVEGFIWDSGAWQSIASGNADLGNTITFAATMAVISDVDYDQFYIDDIKITSFDYPTQNP